MSIGTWLLLGLLAAIVIHKEDGSISLLFAIFLITFGVISLFVVLGYWLWKTKI